MKTKRIYEFDIIRMIATYAVIFIHISAIALIGYQEGSYLAIGTLWINRLLQFAVPVFLFLSGAVIYEKYSLESINIKEFVKSRLLKIVVPYILASLLYIFVGFYLEGNQINIKLVLTSLIFGTAIYHLYYIPILLQLYIFTPAFIFLRKHVDEKLLISIYFIISIYATIYWKFTYSDRIFIKYIVPYTLGLYFGSMIIEWINKLGKYFYILLLASMASLYLYTTEFGYYVYGNDLYNDFMYNALWLIYTTGACFVILKLSNKLKDIKSIKMMSIKSSNFSYYIYLGHPLILSIVGVLIKKWGIVSTSMQLLIYLILVTCISTIIASNVHVFLKYRKKRIRAVIVIVAIMLITVLGYKFGTMPMAVADLSLEKVDQNIIDDYIDSLSKDYEYSNLAYGFTFNYEGYSINNDNELIKTTFENKKTIIDVFHEDFKDTIHSADGYTDYSSKHINDGAYISVEKNEFLSYNGHRLHIIKWKRPTLELIENDKNYYTSIDWMVSSSEIYTIMIHSNEAIDEMAYIARFKIIDKDGSMPAKAIYKSSENKKWNEETKEFYQNNFVDSNIIKWGLFEPSSVHGLEKFYEIENSLDYDFEYVLQYYDLTYPIDAENLKAIYNDGKTLEFTLQTNENGNIESDVMFKILDNLYDEEIRVIAGALKAVEHPVLFRLNNEMDGDWCIYSALNYQKDTRLYVEVWKYIYGIFEEEGLDNIIWVWNPNEKSFPDFKWNHYSNYFPGEEYVDIIGVTGYNTGNYYTGETWREFRMIYDEFMPEFKEVFEGYPFMITEFGSSEFGGDKSAWIGDMFNEIDKYGFKAVIYWNSQDYDVNGNPARIYKFDHVQEHMDLFKQNLIEY